MQGNPAAIPVNFDAFFPRGAFVVGEVEPIVKWSDGGERQGQDLDKNFGHSLWQVRVIYADPDATKRRGEATAKFASIFEPQLPPELNGLPSRPAIFEGLAMTPYVKQGQGRPSVAQVSTSCLSLGCTAFMDPKAAAYSSARAAYAA